MCPRAILNVLKKREPFALVGIITLECLARNVPPSTSTVFGFRAASVVWTNVKAERLQHCYQATSYRDASEKLPQEHGERENYTVTLRSWNAFILFPCLLDGASWLKHHRTYISIKSQLVATIIILLIISISTICFGRQFRPSSGAPHCVVSEFCMTIANVFIHAADKITDVL